MRRKRLTVLAVVSALVILVAVSMTFADRPLPPPKANRQAGKSNTAHLYLYEKDEVNWQPVPGGAWGKLKYKVAGPTFDFVFNGHGLLVGESYTLYYHKDPYGAVGKLCLGSGIVNAEGDIHIAGSVELNTDLPASGDLNADPMTSTYGPPYPAKTGAKIFLARSNIIDCANQKMIGWYHPPYNNILFEADLITYDDTDVP